MRTAASPITLTLNGREITVPAGTTLWEAARQTGIDIPVLCHSPKLNPVGVCRLCVVDVGERTLAASCTRACAEGMSVQTHTPAIEKHRRMLTALLLADHPVPCERERTTGDCELESLGRQYGLLEPAAPQKAKSGERTAAASPSPPLFPPTSASPVQGTDRSSPVIAVDRSACILCDRCIRACDEVQSNNVIGRSEKGDRTVIAFDLHQPMGESTCVSCGECVASCPTGALVNKPLIVPLQPQEQLEGVETVCPYCGVGCAVTYYKTDNTLVFGEGRESPVNQGRLCVKGRYGWDYTLHPQRLTKPLIRREEFYPKGPLSKEVQRSIAGTGRKPGGVVNYDEVLPAFREASWEEALELVGRRLSEIRDAHGGKALAGFGSAKCSNEEAYLFQKLIRAGFGTNNVDHCTRLCHASSVAALLETIGSGAVTNVFADVAHADIALVTGTHTTANHPVAATFIKEAARKGTKLIVVDVRRHELADFATHFAQIRPGTDVAFYNGVIHVLLRDELIDRKFIEQRTKGFEELRELLLKEYPPEIAAEICGVPAEKIEAIAHTIGGRTNPESGSLRAEKAESANRRRKAGNGKRKVESGKPRAEEAVNCSQSDETFSAPPLPRMLIFWGMGIAQHTHGTDNARCLISLCLLTGNVGKPGTGLHPLRGQNNVQGASDAGLIPMVYPDYQSVADENIRRKFEQAWNRPLDPQPGLTVVEIMDAALRGDIRGMYIMGENPFLSDPNSNKVRKALANLEFLVVQDIFLTETAEFADVILPAASYFEKTGTYTNTDRRVQLGRKILDPPGEARPDWEIVCEVGRRIGLPMEYDSPAEIFHEFASLTNNYRTLSHENLTATGKLWPCNNPDEEDGTQILFGDRFPTADGRGKFVPCRFQPAAELPDDDYPFVLNTGRILEHWHTGSMTRRSAALAALRPHAFAKMNPADLQRLNIASGTTVRVTSRRGEIELPLLADDSIEEGSIFIPFHFREAAANVLTTDALDPFGKIPEFKFCAVKVEAVKTGEAVHP